MEERKRAILEGVARGEISPEAGAAELEEMQAAEAAESEAAAVPEPSVDTPMAPPSALVSIGWIRVTSEFGTVQIVGDPTVREAVVEGPHSVRREEGRLVIQHSSIDQVGEFFFGRRGPRTHRERLSIRMNPEIGLEIDSQAGSVQIRQLRSAIRASVQAGTTTIDGFQGPLTLASQAGSIRARGLLKEGESRITCQAGSVRLELERGSSVRVRARAQLGRVRFDGERGQGRLGIGGYEEVVVGEGRATLEIDATMGSVRVETAG